MCRNAEEDAVAVSSGSGRVVSFFDPDQILACIQILFACMLSDAL